MRVIEHLVKTLRDSAVFNPEVQVAPSCILWPDKNRQWEAVVPRLQSELGELLVLGDRIADRDVPRDDLRLGDALADVRNAELLPHFCTVRLIAASTRASFGM